MENRNTMISLACLLFALVAGTSQEVLGDRVDQLKSICADDPKVELTRASELHELVSAPDFAASGCSERNLAALSELDRLINSDDNDNVCSPAKTSQIKAFFSKFVHRKSEAKLPRALEKLFLSYGFNVSRMCKSNMIQSLVSDGHRLLSETDFDRVKLFTSDDSPLGKIMKNTNDVDELILPKEIMALLVKKKYSSIVDGEEQVSIVLESKEARSLNKVKSVCSRRFGPIYEQLILPLVSLSRIGLSYRDDQINGQMKAMREDTEVQRWYRIVFLCESFKSVEILEDPEEAAAANKKVVRVLDSEEAQELRSKQPTGVDAEVGEPIDYQTSGQLKVDDLIVDEQDKSVKKLVGKFSGLFSELGRIKVAEIRQLVRFIKEMLKSGTVAIVKGLMKKGKGMIMNDQLVKMAEDCDNQIPPNGDVNEDETAVTTPGRYKRDALWQVILNLTTFSLLIVVLVVGVGLFIAAAGG